MSLTPSSTDLQTSLCFYIRRMMSAGEKSTSVRGRNKNIERDKELNVHLLLKSRFQLVRSQCLTPAPVLLFFQCLTTGQTGSRRAPTWSRSAPRSELRTGDTAHPQMYDWTVSVCVSAFKMGSSFRAAADSLYSYIIKTFFREAGLEYIQPWRHAHPLKA